MSSFYLRTPNLRGRIDPELERSITEVYEELRKLRSSLLRVPSLVGPSIGDIQQNLQIGGSNPLNVTDLIGGSDYEAEAGVGLLLRTDGIENLTGARTVQGFYTFNLSGEQFRLDDTSATGNPSFSFSQAGIRRSFIKHQDTDASKPGMADNDLRIASEYGIVSIWTGVDGGEDLHFEVGTTGLAEVHHNTGGEVLRLDTLTPTSDIILSFTQADTRRSYLWHDDTADEFKILSEYGPMSLHTGAAGSPVERIGISNAGKVTVSDLTASLLLSTDGTKILTSVADLTSWVAGGTGITVTDDGDGTITIASDGTEVVGPGSSTDNAFSRWDGTSGALLQDSGIGADDSPLVGHFTAKGLGVGTAAPTLDLTEGDFDYTTVDGLHVKSVSQSARVIVEGSLDAAIDLIDLSSAADDEWVQWANSAGRSFFYSLTNAGVTRVANILVMDLGTGNVGVLTNAPAVELEVTGTIRSSDLTASRLVSSDASKNFVSVSDLTSWIAGTAPIAIADDGDGTITISSATATVGPGSATDNALVRWDGTTGYLIQDSSAILLDSGSLTLNHATGVSLNLNRSDSEILDTNVLGQITFSGDDSTGTGAAIIAYATGTWSASSTPASVRFYITPIGSVILSERMHISESAVTVSSTTGGIFSLERENASIVNGNLLGEVLFSAHDHIAPGSSLGSGASISGYATGTWDTDDTPGELRFYTTPSGSGTRSLRAHIDSAGTLNIASLAASRIVASDVSMNVVSVTDLTSWIAGGTNITVVDDGDGTMTVNADLAGDVVGPGSSTDEAVARFNGTTGVLLQNSVATLTDAGLLTSTNLSATSLTAVRLMASDGSKVLASVSDLTSWVAGGTNVTVVNDGDGTLTINADLAGDVVGPGSSTDHAVTRFDGTTGKLLQNSSAILLDSGFLGLGGSPSQLLELQGANTSTSGPHIRLTTAADVYPQFQMLAWQHDSIHFTFDGYFDGSNWVSSDVGSNFQLEKTGDVLRFSYESGIAAASPITWTTAASFDTSGNFNLASLTASRLMSSDGSKNMVSVSDLSSWVAASLPITVANDGDGTITIAAPTAVILSGGFVTDNSVLRANGTGQLAQSSGVTIDDNSLVATPGSFQARGSFAPAGGTGLELSCDGTTGYIYPYDRDLSAYKPLRILASSIDLEIAGVDVLTLTGASVKASQPLEIEVGSGPWMRINDTSATGNPYFQFEQTGSRRSYIQHVDAGDMLTFVSDAGGIEFLTELTSTMVVDRGATFTFDVLKSVNGAHLARFYNADTGAGSFTAVGPHAGSTQAWFYSFSQTYTTSGPLMASSSVIQGAGAGGLNLYASTLAGGEGYPGGFVRIYAGGPAVCLSVTVDHTRIQSTTVPLLQLYRDYATIHGDDLLGAIEFSGADNDGIGARIFASADGEWTSSDTGGYITFQAVDDGTTTLVDRLEVHFDHVLVQGAPFQIEHFTLSAFGDDSGHVEFLNSSGEVSAMFRHSEAHYGSFNIVFDQQQEDEPFIIYARGVTSAIPYDMHRLTIYGGSDSTQGGISTGNAAQTQFLSDKGPGTIHAIDFYNSAGIIPLPDFVFEPDYDHLGISQVEKFYLANHHFPWILKEEWENMPMGQRQAKLLEVDENQQLHITELQRQISQLRKELEDMR